MQAVRALRGARTGSGWDAGSGAVFNLRSNALRPEGWTSADAAGLPIFPLLVRYPEVRAGQIDHALRVTVPAHPARLHPSRHPLRVRQLRPDLPPMGLRLRLKASFSLAGYHGEALVVLRALKRYGLIVADNGSLLVHHRRPRSALEQRRPRPAQAASQAQRSKRSDRPDPASRRTSDARRTAADCRGRTPSPGTNDSRRAPRQRCSVEAGSRCAKASCAAGAGGWPGSELASAPVPGPAARCCQRSAAGGSDRCCGSRR